MPKASKCLPPQCAMKTNKLVVSSLVALNAVESLVVPPNSGSTPPPRPSRKRASVSPDVSNDTPPPKKASPPKKQATPKKEASRTNKQKKAVQRTLSFSAVWDGTVRPQATQVVPPHTLLLGTHPSIASLSEDQYYGHTMNAFWWIAGDCLGFRRATGLNKSGQPYGFVPHVRHENIIPYEEQLATMTSHGFCMWDIIGSCIWPGSLDQDIKEEVPNDIQGFCKEHPSIQRIVVANGGSGAKFFTKYNKEWLQSGALKANDDEQTKKSFKILAKVTPNPNAIVLVAPLAVSPAAARYTYQDKRDFWEQHVYQPGLKILKTRHAS